MTEQVVPTCSGEGVIVANPSPKTISPAKGWRFTLNNYTESEYCSIVPTIRELCEWGIMAKEIGESGTPHIQGALHFKKKCRFTDKISIRRDGVECIRAFKNTRHGRTDTEIKNDNIEYCSKSGDVLFRKGVPKPIITIKKEDFYPWQQKLVDIFEKECEWDDRTIYWYLPGS